MRRAFIQLSSASLVTCLSLVFAAAPIGFAQSDEVLCRGGNGSFTENLRGEKVRVGPTQIGGLATRSCEATLSWGGQNLAVATGAWEVDLDALDVDLGVGLPIAAFQVTKSESECCSSYQIYSLQKPPRLVRTLSGSATYRASDTDMDGRVEIWTDDTPAIDGFESFTASEIDIPPPVILRFEHEQLFDVSAEFQTYFDHLIAETLARLNARDAKDFKESDGRLQLDLATPPERAHRLRRAKVRILEIAWLYLYSGREREAWAALSDLWPAADVERIRAEIVKARSRGIHAQLDGISAAKSERRKHAAIFNVIAGPRINPETVPPRAILLRRPPPKGLEVGVTTAEMVLDLVIDSAGKVRSVEPARNSKSIDPDLIDAAKGWKFIPALDDNRPVASRMRLAVSTRR